MRGAPRTLLVAIALAIAVPAAASTLDTLTFTMPDTMPAPGYCDSLSGVPESANGPGYTMLAQLERMRYPAEFDWVVIDSLWVPPGARDSFIVDLIGCRPCAYRVQVVDAARNPACRPGNSVNRWDGGEPVGVVDRQPAFQLGQVTPMPVRHRAVVEFQLAQQSEAVLELFDLSGRRVRTLTSGVQAAGHHLALFDASSLPAGLYLLRLQAGERQALRRVVVMR